MTFQNEKNWQQKQYDTKNDNTKFVLQVRCRRGETGISVEERFFVYCRLIYTIDTRLGWWLFRGTSIFEFYKKHLFYVFKLGNLNI